MFWHANASMKCLGIFLFFLAGLLPLQSRPWVEDIIYFAHTHRFYEGDTSNHFPVGCDPALYDLLQKNLNDYQGGDLCGLEKALATEYFTDLGNAALWITPPVKNWWVSDVDLGAWKTGYHDYWADVPKWNLTKAGPSRPMTLLGRKIRATGVLGDLFQYSRKGFNGDSLGANDGGSVDHITVKEDSKVRLAMPANAVVLYSSVKHE
jgi:hypothetical protein